MSLKNKNMMKNTVLMVEFNELCPPLLERFIANGRLPNFAKFHQESQVFVTDAQEEGELLNPWIQWVTAHTGESASQHGVETLSEGGRVAGRNLWDVLSENGLSSWVCGSMNASYQSPLNGHLIPDPWSSGVRPYPSGKFDSYYEFVRSAVQEHSNEDADQGWAAKLAFLSFMLRNGISFDTQRQIVRQLAGERFADVYWRRASIMDLLQWDVFRSVYKRGKPNFATFFVNSTAHYQHCYWRHMEPKKFASTPSDAELSTYKDSVLFGYQAMDSLLGKFLQLAKNDVTVIFATALSQQPFLDFEDRGGRNYYRVRSSEVLKSNLGIVDHFEFEPVMAEQFYLRFDTPEAASRANDLLNAFRVSRDGHAEASDPAAFHVQQRGENDLLVQSNCTSTVETEAILWTKGREETVPFHQVFYRLEATKSGKHHPDGALWIRLPSRSHKLHPDKVPLSSLAPTVLEMFGLAAPNSMKAEPLTSLMYPGKAAA